MEDTEALIDNSMHKPVAYDELESHGMSTTVISLSRTY